jgi:hypothetical protein
MIILLISVLIKTFHQGMKLLLFALSWFLSYPPPKNGCLCVNYHNLQLTGGADYFHLRIEKNWGKFIFRITRNLFILWFELEYAPQWVPPPPPPPPNHTIIHHHRQEIIFSDTKGGPFTCHPENYFQSAMDSFCFCIAWFLFPCLPFAHLHLFLKKDGFCPYTLWTHVMHVFGLVMGI